MTIEEATEYRRHPGRYVKRNMGMWTDLPWYYRVPLSPLYALMFWYYCVRGVDMNFQVLHDEDYEPDDADITQCPQCERMTSADVKIRVGVER